MKAFLIARVSTEDQIDALPAQVHRLLDYAKRRAYEPDLIEFQESAYKGERDEFKAIISRIQASGEPVAVVFDKIDRYTRDSSAEEVRILQGLYRSGAIELHFPSDNLVIHKDSPATDIMRLGLGSSWLSITPTRSVTTLSVVSSRCYVMVYGLVRLHMVIRMLLGQAARSQWRLML